MELSVLLLWEAEKKKYFFSYFCVVCVFTNSFGLYTSYMMDTTLLYDDYQEKKEEEEEDEWIKKRWINKKKK